MNSYSFQILSIALLGLGLGHPAVAQPSQISLSLQGEDITGISIETETAPADDSVLLEAPDQLQLEFAYDVRLVKLTLRNGLRDWVDIDFRYDPTIQEKFQWNIPELTQATYYTADWAILATNDRLIRGSFSFSFGPEAQAPSVIKAAEALVLDSISAGPNARFVRPPRTNIILNQDQPSYDPPFTIKLEDGPAEQSLDSSVEPR
ncbi:copper resistance protein CopC [Gammaproteobacteria bacterium]|nr:copper resistance protein CopC [Gammaproteobacteria bacterium]